MIICFIIFYNVKIVFKKWEIKSCCCCCCCLNQNNLFCLDNVYKENFHTDKLAGIERVKKRFFDLGFRRIRYCIPNLPRGSFDFELTFVLVY